MADKYELNNEELSQISGGLDCPDDAGKEYKGEGEILKNGVHVETVKSDMGFGDMQLAIKDIKEKLDNALGSISFHATSRFRISYKKKDGGTAYTDYEEYKQSGY